MGVTGTRASVSAATEGLVARTRAAGAENVCVGLGVTTGDQAAEVGSYADGVIVGSAFVRTLLEDEDHRTASLAARATVDDDLRAVVAPARRGGGAARPYSRARGSPRTGCARGGPTPT